MAEDKEKLINFRKSQNLTQKNFADSLGMTQSTIAMIEKGSRPAPPNFKIKFAKKYGIDWDSFKSIEETPLHNKDENIIPIPYFTEAFAAAGEGINIPAAFAKETLYFDKRWLENIIGVNFKNAILIQAKGKSMEGGQSPIKDGDLLLVDISYKEVINDKIFVIQIDNDLRVKRLKKDFSGKIWVLSNNEKEFPPEELKKEAFIIGKVVWNGSKENV